MKRDGLWLIALFMLTATVLLYGQPGQLPVRVVEAHPPMLHAAKLNLPVVPDKEPLEKLPGMRYFNPADYLTQVKTYPNGKPKPVSGFASARFFMEELDDVAGVPAVEGKVITADFLKRYAQPFYFKQWEVTNEEYWDFVNYVIDSSAHAILQHYKPDGSIDWEQEIFWKAFPLHPDLIVTANGKRVLRKEALIYSYENTDGKRVATQVYPDTSCWRVDWPGSYNQPMVKAYFTHSAFNEYPVVGVNYHQAQAFCDWKTKQLNGEAGTWKWKVRLPSIVEWEWMAAWDAEREDCEEEWFDTEWVTDLWLADYERLKAWANPLTQRVNRSNMVQDGSLYTYPADMSSEGGIRKALKEKRSAERTERYLNLHKDGVAGMGGNVSEWLRENYQDYWAFPFRMRQQRLASSDFPEAPLIQEIEQYYHQLCDTTGQLVIGSNWADERYGNVLGRNKAGIYAKTFVDPARQHATLGFRYVVVRVHPRR